MSPLDVFQLTDRVARDKSQKRRMARSPETKKLTNRTASKQYGRVSLISLTAQGEDMVQTLTDVLAETINDRLTPLTEGERATIKEMMQRVIG